MIVAITAFLPMSCHLRRPGSVALEQGIWLFSTIVLCLRQFVRGSQPPTSHRVRCLLWYCPMSRRSQRTKGQCRRWWQRDHNKQKPQVAPRDLVWGFLVKTACKSGRQCVEVTASPSPLLLSPIARVCFRSSPVSLRSFSCKWQKAQLSLSTYKGT